MQKVACVFSFKMSSWVSCQKIVFNLHRAWSLTPDLELLDYNYSSNQSPADIYKLAHDLFTAKPEVIVIMDHKPHPMALLHILLPLYLNEPKPPRFIFHIFGDFSLYYQEWNALSGMLKNLKIDFIVASERQKLLIDKMLMAPLKSFICPFPVDEKEFFYATQNRISQRKVWGISDGDIAFIFTGRLTLQKRIHTLVSTFASTVKELGCENAHLFIYGNTDDIGDPFMGKWETTGEYFRKIHRIYHSQDDEVRKKIHFMGNVPNEELAQVYQGADVLVNLSVHNDEDYGMSVAEAQACGLPSILTDWGGLAGFRIPKLDTATIFIPVKIGNTSKVISKSKVKEAFAAFIEAGASEQRKSISDSSLKKFSIEAAQEQLKLVLKHPPKPFDDFSVFFRKVCSKHKLTKTPYITRTQHVTNIYREIYSAYVSGN
ncbi:MAG TPA: glycosyltransferase family 4 protein [Bacteriovoracaceae bacterium]|nr:glycosyltransferase family 4 protein [Bacteriovoracaceae bacterium]